MKKELAETLLAKTMNWSDEQKAAERAFLDSFAGYKYDEYQQFSPGLRFVESLALWLRQFEGGAARNDAYSFVRDSLVFVSTAELNYLVNLAFPTFVRPVLMAAAASDVGAPEAHRVKEIAKLPGYRARLRKTLVLGLSDGARTDQFRRFNPHEISHEQVFHAYDISNPKAAAFTKKLKKDLSQIYGSEPKDEDTRFEYVVLLDDFTASGTSYIRREANGTMDGKIAKIVAELEKLDGLGGAIATSDVKVIVIIYVAADQAIDHIEKYLPSLKFSKGTIAFEVVHKLGAKAKLSSPKDDAILKLAAEDRYFDSSADDEHAEVGGESRRFGYAGCKLPVVLSHNTPNNSIFLLCAEEEYSVLGLFPRVSRHRKFE